MENYENCVKIVLLTAENNNKKPIVLVFTTAYDPFIGGAEIAILENVKRMQGEFDFFILTARFRKELPRREFKEGARIIRLGFGKPWDKFLLPITCFFYSCFLLAHFRSRPRVLWVVMASYGSIAASTLKLFFPKVPYILTLQEGDTEEHLRKSRFYLVNILGFRYAFKMCDFVTAISAYLLDVAHRFNYQGMGKVLPNGVDLSNFMKEINAEEIEEVRGHLALKGNEKIIITTSRLVSKNGLDTVIRALAIIRKKEKKLPVKFLILGVGPEAHNLKDLARSLGVLDDIIFAGEFSHKNLLKYLKLADVFVRPARSEGFGNSFIEAMAAEIPVIATPVGGIPDFLKDQKTGFFAKVDDPDDLSQKILSVIKGEINKNEVISAAKKLVIEKYDWEKISQNFSKLFLTQIDRFSKPLILLATGIFPSDIGGPATYTKTIAEELAKRNFIIKVITYADDLKSPSFAAYSAEVSSATKAGKAAEGKQIPNTAGYKLITVSRRIPKGLRHFIYFCQCLKNGFNTDIFYAQDVISAGFPAYAASIFLRKNFFLKITGDYAWEQGMARFGVDDAIDLFQAQKYGIAVEFLRALQAFIARHSDKIIVPSHYLKNLAVGWGARYSKITVIYNSVGANAINKNKDVLRRELKILPEEKIIISIGRIVKWKGFGAVIDIFSGLIKNRPQLKLIIIGDGPERGNLELKIGGSGLGNHIALLGKINHEEIFKYLRASDIFILNTAYEGFSHQLVEALGAGIPVITTACGGNAEIIQDKENGLLVAYNGKNDIKGAIEILLTDSGLYSKLSENGIKTAKQFTKKRMIDELIKFISV